VLNPDGLLIITGREQAVLNLGGDKISPEAIELILTQFSGVIESAAFSAPNAYGNNEIRALIVSREKLDDGLLRAHCEARAPRGFAPVQYYFVDSLPHNEMGKIDRRRVRELVDRMTAQTS
jgi:acyl-coenzyme A synthetase/AMP-(fatty) acid ligase